ncbi:zinc finger CCCH domain-containing protein 52-like [Andrographis paniculata]|uniref:zinc finger CCCH domain-containing protein 52-like n=1 Tax=Andrographis paniculata TaxID=175694 RepID=UPI0021E9A1E7|nr:zinc finger CCCH domain-containing protein 52-like [Andrographis paniculata]
MPMPREAAMLQVSSTSTAKIPMYASLLDRVIGKDGVYSQQIYYKTGVKLAVIDHETDPKLQYVELTGTYDGISVAADMIHYDMANRCVPMASRIKTKLCKKFLRGHCLLGDKCWFAHGEKDLRKNHV